MSLNRKIRVLHMGIDDRRGGIETFLVELARNIDWNSFQFDFFCYGNNPAYAEELKSYGARLISLPNRKNFVAYRNAIRASLDDGYDILHLHKNSPADFLPLLWSGKTKVVAHSHNGEHSSGLIGKTVNDIGRHFFSKKPDLKLACSKPAGEWLFGNDAFIVFPNSVNVKDYFYSETSRVKVRNEWGIDDSEFVIGAVGRLVEQKNYPFLLSLFSEFHASHPSCVLAIAGEGELRQPIESEIQKLGLQDSVRILGRYNDMPALYSAFDCLCVPSVYEGFSFVTLEAQVSGLFTVVSPAVPDEAIVTARAVKKELDRSVWLAELDSCYNHLNKVERSLTEDELSSVNCYDVKTAASKLMGMYEKVLGC